MRILVVEDEKQLAQFLRQGLEQEGYAVHCVHAGPDALAVACDRAFDLILLDWMLPGFDGLSVCRTLRDGGNRTPIIMLTAKDATTDKVVGLDSGADDYLTKPFAFDELLARIRSVLRRTESGSPPQLVVGDLVLDPAAHVVIRGERQVSLTARESALLEYFMRRPGQAVCRADILRHVWGYDHDPRTNVLDVYVRYLRRKLDPTGEQPFLRTVVNVGYVLET